MSYTRITMRDKIHYKPRPHSLFLPGFKIFFFINIPRKNQYTRVKHNYNNN